MEVDDMDTQNEQEEVKSEENVSPDNIQFKFLIFWGKKQTNKKPQNLQYILSE